MPPAYIPSTLLLPEAPAQRGRRACGFRGATLGFENTYYIHSLRRLAHALIRPGIRGHLLIIVYPQAGPPCRPFDNRKTLYRKSAVFVRSLLRKSVIVSDRGLGNSVGVREGTGSGGRARERCTAYYALDASLSVLLVKFSGAVQRSMC